MKQSRPKYALLPLVLVMVGLYVLHDKAIVPFVMRIVHTQFFTGDPELGGQATAIRDDMTAMASIHCKTFIKQRLAEHASRTFPANDYKAWNIGFGRYLVQSSVDIETADGASRRQNTLCKIRYTGGDEADSNNWRLIGIDSKPTGEAAAESML